MTIKNYFFAEAGLLAMTKVFGSLNLFLLK